MNTMEKKALLWPSKALEQSNGSIYNSLYTCMGLFKRGKKAKEVVKEKELRDHIFRNSHMQHPKLHH